MALFPLLLAGCVFPSKALKRSKFHQPTADSEIDPDGENYLPSRGTIRLACLACEARLTADPRRSPRDGFPVVGTESATFSA